MKLSIQIPAELRQKIVDFKAELNGERAARESERNKWLKSQVEATEALASVTAELAQIQQANEADWTAATDDAVMKFTRLEKREESLRQQLRQAEAGLDHLEKNPLFMYSGALLKELASVYREQLMEKLTMELLPVCDSEHEAQQLAGQTHAVQSLWGMRNGAVAFSRQPATPDRVAKLYRVFDRALAGKPALTFDPAEAAGVAAS